MTITVLRKWKKADYTIGKLYADGRYVCDTLEDRDRGLRQDMSESNILKRKVRGKTAIPTGTYEITYSYSPKFKKVMPLVGGVPGFSAIRIHPGNTTADTDGCVLVGWNRQKGMVVDSRKAFAVVDAKIRTAIKMGEKVWMRIE